MRRAALGRAARGFTLIEVLIALAIVSVALAAVMRAVSVATDDQGRIRDRRLALLCVQNRWEEVRLQAVPLEDARWQCAQGRLRFTGVQHIERSGNGSVVVSLVALSSAAPGQRLAALRVPWSAPDASAAP